MSERDKGYLSNRDDPQKSVPGIDTSGQNIDIKAALERRKAKKLAEVQDKNLTLPVRLVLERTKALSENMKAPLRPYVANMVQIGESELGKDGKPWGLRSWMAHVAQEAHPWEPYPKLFETLLLTDIEASREKVNSELITASAKVDTFTQLLEPIYSNTQNFYDLYLGVNLLWKNNEKIKQIGVYSCYLLKRSANKIRYPDYVVVRPPYDSQIFKADPKPDKYLSQGVYDTASEPTTELIADAIVDAYLKAEQTDAPWTLLLQSDSAYTPSRTINTYNPWDKLKHTTEGRTLDPISTVDVTRRDYSDIFRHTLQPTAKGVDTLLQHFGLPRSTGGWDK